VSAVNHAPNLINPVKKIIWSGSWVHDEFGAKGNALDTHGDTGVKMTDKATITTTSNSLGIVSGTGNLPTVNECSDWGALNDELIQMAAISSSAHPVYNVAGAQLNDKLSQVGL